MSTFAWGDAPTDVEKGIDAMTTNSYVTGTATAQPFPAVYAASYPAFTCCLCTMGDEHRHVLISRPLYAQAVLCPGCNHTICYDHQVQVCHLCEACCWEQHGSHVADDRP